MDWRKQVENYIADMDKRYDGNLKGLTSNMYYRMTPEYEIQRKEISARRKKMNEEKYGLGEWIVRSPGNDLLDFYDEQMLILDINSKAYSRVPPSVVYHYRYDHKYPDIIFDKSANYGRWAYLKDQLSSYFSASDNSYYAQVYNTRFHWLKDNPCNTWRFKYKKDALEFIQNYVQQKTLITPHNYRQHFHNHEIHEFMWWRGKAAGWSVIYNG